MKWTWAEKNPRSTEPPSVCDSPWKSSVPVQLQTSSRDYFRLCHSKTYLTKLGDNVMQHGVCNAGTAHSPECLRLGHDLHLCARYAVHFHSPKTFRKQVNGLNRSVGCHLLRFYIMSKFIRHTLRRPWWWLVDHVNAKKQTLVIKWWQCYGCVTNAGSLCPWFCDCLCLCLIMNSSTLFAMTGLRNVSRHLWILPWMVCLC